jgi:hypothetical protein
MVRRQACRFGNAVFLDTGLAAFHLDCRKFLAACFRRQIEAQVKVARAERAEAGSQMDGQGSDHDVTGLHRVGIQVVELQIDMQTLARRPGKGARVAGNKVGGQGWSSFRYFMTSWVFK